jgi:hypothetical protein
MSDINFKKTTKTLPDVGFKKISANETDYGTGAKRDARGGKGAQKWLPHEAIDLVSHVYELGNLGRGWRNWEFGMPLEDLLDSAKRHIVRYMAGDRSEPHLPQALWNLLNALQMSIWIWQGVRPQSLNNLPDHRHFWYPDMPPPCPLSPKEIEWLRGAGLTEDTANVDDKYLAGIVDGEGTISIVYSGGYYYPRIAVYNNAYSLLQKLLAHFPCGNINQCREATEVVAASYALYWNGIKAIEVVKRIAPFLVIKKRQADLVITWATIKSMLESEFLTQEQANMRFADLKAQMHILNKKGPKDSILTPELNAVSIVRQNKRTLAEEFLKSALTNGPRRVVELLKEAKTLGITKDALKRTKVRVGVSSTGIGSKSLWYIKESKIKPVVEGEQ